MRKTLFIALMTGSLALGAVSTYAGGENGPVPIVGGSGNCCPTNYKLCNGAEKCQENASGEMIQCYCQEKGFWGQFGDCKWYQCK